MKKEQNITTHKTTRGFIITVLNYDKYQTFNNYKNDTQNDTQTKRKRNANDTITKEWKNERINNWDEEIKKNFWDIYPHSRKGKKQEALKYVQQQEPDIVLQMVKLYKREVAVWMQDAKYVPACERWARDFVPYSSTMQDQKLKSIYYKLLDEREVENIKIFTEDFWQEKIMEMYNQRKDENRNKLLSALMK